MFLSRLIEEQKRQIQREKNKEVAKNIIVGASIGAGLGILFAPKSGEDTRSDLANKSKELGEDIKESIEDKKDNINSWKETLSQIKSDIKFRIEEGHMVSENQIQILNEKDISPELVKVMDDLNKKENIDIDKQ